MPLSGNKLEVNQIRGKGGAAQPISISGGDGSHTGTCAPVIQAGFSALPAGDSTLTGPQHCGSLDITPTSNPDTLTTLTGPLLDAYYAGDLPIGASWQLVINNKAAATNAATLAAGTGNVISGTAAVAANTVGVFQVFKESAGVFIFRRLDA